MIVYDLKCGNAHIFEAWFGSSSDYDDQRARGLVACPMCGDGTIEKAVMAPNIATAGNIQTAQTAAPLGPNGVTPEVMKAAMAELAVIQKKALEGSTWVGKSFANRARAMHEAAMVLESSHVAVLMPHLAPRGDRPAGEGPRFVLRVQADDVERAQGMLNRASEDREEDELRCPKCGSYTVHVNKYEFTNFLLGFAGKGKPVDCECMKCHYKGDPAEFGE